jgi:hypothetical protein
MNPSTKSTVFVELFALCCFMKATSARNSVAPFAVNDVADNLTTQFLLDGSGQKWECNLEMLETSTELYSVTKSTGHIAVMLSRLFTRQLSPAAWMEFGSKGT